MAWFNVFRKTGEAEQVIADEFDCLAAMVRFASVKERSFAFYQKHRLAVDQALEFILTLRAESRELGFMLSGSSTPVAKVAQTLRQRVSELHLSARGQEMVDNGASELLPLFLPLLADTSRPAYLEECRWIVKHAADKASATTLAGAMAE